MRVLYTGRYNETEILNGPEKVAKRIFKHAAEEVQTVFAEYFFDGRQFGVFKKLFGKETIIVGKNPVYRFGLFSLLFFLNKFKPDVIHIITFERFALICFLYKIFSGAKIIYNAHGIIKYENSELRKTATFLKFKDSVCEKIFFLYSDLLIFHSVFSKELSEKYYKSRKNYRIIPNGIDDVFFITGQNKQSNINNILKLVFAGDLPRSEKGFDFFSGAIGKIDFDLKCYIIGDRKNPLLIEYGKAEMNFVNKMTTRDFAEFLSDKDVFVSAGFYENFSMTTAETMACGLAPVITSETGISSFINNGVNGYVFRFGDEMSLIEYLKLLSKDRVTLNEVSSEAKKIYASLCWGKIYSEYRKIYDEYSLSGK